MVPVPGGQRRVRCWLGHGQREANIFTWFAKRPLAQAKAAVITSLLPWPDDPGSSAGFRTWSAVRGDQEGRYDEAHDELVAERPATTRPEPGCSTRSPGGQ